MMRIHLLRGPVLHPMFLGTYMTPTLCPKLWTVCSVVLDLQHLLHSNTATLKLLQDGFFEDQHLKMKTNHIK